MLPSYTVSQQPTACSYNGTCRHCSDTCNRHCHSCLQLLEMVRPAASKLGLESPVELWSYFVQQCKLRLHVVLCLSPIGSAFRDRLRQNPSLVNCCTIDWFQVLCLVDVMATFVAKMSNISQIVLEVSLQAACSDRCCFTKRMCSN